MMNLHSELRSLFVAVLRLRGVIETYYTDKLSCAHNPIELIRRLKRYRFKIRVLEYLSLVSAFTTPFELSLIDLESLADTSVTYSGGRLKFTSRYK